MISIAATLLLLFPVEQNPESGTIGAFRSYFDGESYWTEVTKEAVESSPDWDEDRQNPPIAARYAAKLATERKDALVGKSRAAKWKVESLYLMKTTIDNKWFWCVRFSDIPNDDDTSMKLLPVLCFVVLMDGTVVEPPIKAKEDELTIEDRQRIKID